MINYFPYIFKICSSAFLSLLLTCTQNLSPCLWSQLAQMHPSSWLPYLLIIKHKFDNVTPLRTWSWLPIPCKKNPKLLDMAHETFHGLHLHLFAAMLHQQGMVDVSLGNAVDCLFAFLHATLSTFNLFHSTFRYTFFQSWPSL